MPKEQTQFKPGKSGNPKGRPTKANCIPDILKKIGERLVCDDPLISEQLKQKFESMLGATKLDAVLELVYVFALRGDSWAVDFIANRTEGKPKERVDVTGVNFPKEINISFRGKQKNDAS